MCLNNGGHSETDTQSHLLRILIKTGLFSDSEEEIGAEHLLILKRLLRLLKDF